jgi:hypothetical protein
MVLSYQERIGLEAYQKKRPRATLTVAVGFQLSDRRASERDGGILAGPGQHKDEFAALAQL